MPDHPSVVAGRHASVINWVDPVIRRGRAHAGTIDGPVLRTATCSLGRAPMQAARLCCNPPAPETVSRRSVGQAKQKTNIRALMQTAHPPPGLAASPLSILAGALQFAGLASILLIHPVVLAEAVGAAPEVAQSMVSLTLVALAVGTLLQAFVVGPVGSGTFCPSGPSVIHLLLAMLAVHVGSLPLLLGMTLATGVMQLLLAPLLPRMRSLLPPEIIGVVAVLVGVATSLVGWRVLLDSRPVSPDIARVLVVVVGSLLVMVMLAVWARGLWRAAALGAGAVSGYALSCVLDLPLPPEAGRYADAPLLGLPSIGHVGIEFAPEWLFPCLVAAIAASLKTAGNLTALQHAHAPDWRRADLHALRGGVLADGLSATIAGAIGAHGVSCSTSAAGLALASRYRGRKVAVASAVVLLALACSPKAASLLWLMPSPVVIAVFMFCGVFVAVSGLQLMTSRMIDSRRGLVIGLGLMAGLAVDLHPGMVQALPTAMQPLVGSALVIGSSVALALTVLFRIRSRRRSVLVVDPEQVDLRPVDDFMTLQGAAWGARQDVVVRASSAIVQAVETIARHDITRGPVEVSASFDEFNLDVVVAYDGAPLEFPPVRPSIDAIADDPDGERRLAGFLIRRLADRVAAMPVASRTQLLLHFEH